MLPLRHREPGRTALLRAMRRRDCPLACPACGFANEAGEKFCGGCGATLAATVDRKPRLPAAGQGQPNGDGERRPVTVLFADLVDYTRMSQALDPEDVHAMLGRFYEVADEIVERFGGSIDKHIGDSVMAVFGAPVAHDDDAIRAVRAAAEIQRTMPTLGGGAGQPLAVHIGIASGEVVASGLGGARHRAYTVIGNSVNLAARLLKLAGAGRDRARRGGACRGAAHRPVRADRRRASEGDRRAVDGMALRRVRRRRGSRGRASVRRAAGGAGAARGVVAQLRGGRDGRHRARARRRRNRQVAPRRRIAPAGAGRRDSSAIPGSCSISGWPKGATPSAKSSSA